MFLGRGADLPVCANVHLSVMEYSTPYADDSRRGESRHVRRKLVRLNLSRTNDQLPTHLRVPRVVAQVGIERERPRAIGAELNDGRASGRHSLRDAVIVDREPVGVVRAVNRELDEVVLLSLHAIRGEAVIACSDGELPARGGLNLGRWRR